MSGDNELKTEARKRATKIADTFGWPIPGREYQDEYDDILDQLTNERKKRDKENKMRA